MNNGKKVFENKKSKATFSGGIDLGYFAIQIEHVIC